MGSLIPYWPWNPQISFRFPPLNSFAWKRNKYISFFVWAIIMCVPLYVAKPNYFLIWQWKLTFIEHWLLSVNFRMLSQLIFTIILNHRYHLSFYHKYHHHFLGKKNWDSEMLDKFPVVIQPTANWDSNPAQSEPSVQGLAIVQWHIGWLQGVNSKYFRGHLGAHKWRATTESSAPPVACRWCLHSCMKAYLAHFLLLPSEVLKQKV